MRRETMVFWAALLIMATLAWGTTYALHDLESHPRDSASSVSLPGTSLARAVRDGGAPL